MSFCSRASLASNEHFAGTGVRGEAYVFLPVPKRLWRGNEMNSGWASHDEQAAIRAGRKAGIVTRLYNPNGGEAGQPPAAAIVYAAPGAHPAALQALLATVARRWPIDQAGGPRLAICTHGTRDRCCAKWGFAAYKTARQLFETGASSFEPLECSHLGGDRFAATGVFFPSGSMYAHLDHLDLEGLAAAEAAGRLEPDFYRGRVFDPQLTQLARAGLAKAGAFNDATAPVVVTAHHPTELEALAGARRYRVALTPVEVVFYGSCGDMSAGKGSRGRRFVVGDAELLEDLDPASRAARG